MPSIVAIETISTYETTPGQAFSSSSLMKSILLKPSRSEMVFITIAVINKDRSTTALIKKNPQKIKTNKLIPKNKWQEITTSKIKTYNFLSSSSRGMLASDLNYE